MKNKMQILGRISLGLLICKILGQGIWLYRVREMENHGFEQTVGRGLNDILWVEVIFLIGFIVCLVWQRVVAKRIERRTLVQMMGKTPSEEIPLTEWMAVIDGKLQCEGIALSVEEELKLNTIKTHLVEMAETIDMQQSALKTSVWKIDRENIDLKSEMEMIVELFSLIRPQALVGYQIDEGAEYPCLDKVYFYYLILCLVDKAIVSAGVHPVVRIEFYTDKKHYMLTVEDNGRKIDPGDRQPEQSTGAGLAFVVQQVVGGYGGKIRFISKPNGNKCVITLPQKRN